MARKRTAKSLGTRHDRNYFREWTKARMWRVGLTVALPALAVIWLVSFGIRGNATPYTSGPLSSVHNVFGNDCEACHATKKSLLGRVGFQKHVSDDACLQCHTAPAHQENAIFTPECSSCHTEHKGTKLADVNEKDCTQCHSDLKTRTGNPRFVRAIESFTDNHPEFAVVQKQKDPGGIKLNHEVHLGKNIRGPNGNVQLECSDCHRANADSDQPWPYADPVMGKPTPDNPTQVAGRQASMEHVNPHVGRSYMAPIKYYQQCAQCHQLQFDARIADVVPHGKPDEVRDFVVKKYREYLAAHPNVWKESPIGTRKIPNMTPPKMAHSPEEWVTMQTEVAETLLWRKTCQTCHTLNDVPGKPAPEVKPANIPPRWFEHSMFSHYAHQAVKCDSCHSKVRTSKETSDVLIPGIKTCRACHNGESTQVGSTDDGCFVCHQYHDWTKAKGNLKSAYSIQQLLTKRISLPNEQK